MTDPLVSAAEAMAIGTRLYGAEIGFALSLPFIGLLLSIAVFPLLAAYFWERHFGKVAALWTFALLLPCAVVFGLRMTAAQVLHTFLLDYLPFIILLFALFVVAAAFAGQRQSRRHPSPSSRRSFFMLRGEYYRTLPWMRSISGIVCGLAIAAIWLSVMWVLWDYLFSLYP